jgi:hypothetical protein
VLEQRSKHFSACTGSQNRKFACVACFGRLSNVVVWCCGVCCPGRIADAECWRPVSGFPKRFRICTSSTAFLPSDRGAGAFAGYANFPIALYWTSHLPAPLASVHHRKCVMMMMSSGNGDTHYLFTTTVSSGSARGHAGNHISALLSPPHNCGGRQTTW